MAFLKMRHLERKFIGAILRSSLDLSKSSIAKEFTAKHVVVEGVDVVEIHWDRWKIALGVPLEGGGMPSPESRPMISNLTRVSRLTFSAIQHMFMRPPPGATPNSMIAMRPIPAD